MAVHAIPTMHLRVIAASEAVKNAVFQEAQDLFELDIVPAAKELSPVTPTGYERNLALKAEHKLGGRRVGGTGTNRRSIDSEVTQLEHGVQARVFTTSGYGAYLELGTSRMAAQPYLWPAFEQHIGALNAKVKARVSSMGGDVAISVVTS